MKISIILGMMVFIILFAGEALAKRYYVKPDGDDNTTGTTWQNAFATLTRASAMSKSGDEVWVAAGTYIEGDEVVILEGVVFYGGFVGGETDLFQRNVEKNKAIVDGNGSYRCINNYGIIDGLYITGGKSDDGGGIYNDDGTVINCTIYGNTASDDGGGIFNYFNGKVINCTIYKNTAFSDGGGIDTCGGTIFNCMIYQNTASYFGGGIYNSWASVTNCTIYGNVYDGIYQERGGLVTNSISWQNLSVDIIIPKNTIFCCYGGASQEYENISADPLFVNTSGNISTWDFRLQDASPCIDAGHPNHKYNDACLPPGKGTKRNDMGAYGGPYNCGWLSIIKQDIIDHILGRINLSEEQKNECDQNKDGFINVCDVLFFLN